MSIASMLVNNKIENNKSIDTLNSKVDSLSKTVDNLQQSVNDLHSKVDKMIEMLQVDIKEDCQKMAEHIDFIENVYDNVKNPLGYLCNTVKKFTGGNTQYTLESNNFNLLNDDVEYNSDFSDDEEDGVLT
jgi:uncharacterized protein YydD (DUF2326 family)